MLSFYGLKEKFFYIYMKMKLSCCEFKNIMLLQHKFIAIKNGHLECVKYAHENGCPWNDIGYKEAEENGNIVCMKYFIEN